MPSPPILHQFCVLKAFLDTILTSAAEFLGWLTLATLRERNQSKKSKLQSSARTIESACELVMESIVAEQGVSELQKYCWRLFTRQQQLTFGQQVSSCCQYFATDSPFSANVTMIYLFLRYTQVKFVSLCYFFWPSQSCLQLLGKRRWATSLNHLTGGWNCLQGRVAYRDKSFILIHGRCTAMGWNALVEMQAPKERSWARDNDALDLLNKLLEVKQRVTCSLCFLIHVQSGGSHKAYKRLPSSWSSLFQLVVLLKSVQMLIRCALSV